MTAKLVVRLMSAAREVIAWGELRGEPRGDGCLWAVGSFVDRAAQDGAIVAVNVHWTDLHVHRTWPLPPLGVHAGDPVSFAWPSDQPVFQIPGEATPLPPVTVGQAVAVSVPVGVAGARGN